MDRREKAYKGKKGEERGDRQKEGKKLERGGNKLGNTKEEGE